jgi:membrane protein YqaA with SNARE-associated domain
MTLWLLLAATLLVQEGIATTAIFFKAYQEHYSVIIITVLWLVLTVGQIYLAYYLGVWMKRRWANTKWEKRMESFSKQLEDSIGKYGERLALVLGSFIVSPAVTAFVAPWLDISFGNVLIFALIGDLGWYLSEWFTVVGTLHYLLKFKQGTFIVIAVGLVISIGMRLLRKKNTH